MKKEELKKEELKKVKAYQDKNGGWYLRLEYDCEDDFKIYKAIIPKVELPIPKDQILLEPYIDSYINDRINMKLRLYNDIELPIHKDPISDVSYEEIIFKEKVKELTIEEIEKRLGFKVKIIAPKEDKKDEN